MAVYVDSLRDWGWRLGPSCHMIADTNEELHAMAERIGLLRRWFCRYCPDPAFNEILRRWRSAAIAQIQAGKDAAEQKQIRDHLYR